MTKCKYADRYKGLRAPTCGCDVCEKRWYLAEKKRAEDLVKDLKLSIPETRRALHIQATTGEDHPEYGRPLFTGWLKNAMEGIFAAIIVMLVIIALYFIISNAWLSL